MVLGLAVARAAVREHSRRGNILASQTFRRQRCSRPTVFQTERSSSTFRVLIKQGRDPARPCGRFRSSYCLGPLTKANTFLQRAIKELKTKLAWPSKTSKTAPQNWPAGAGARTLDAGMLLFFVKSKQSMILPVLRNKGTQ